MLTPWKESYDQPRQHIKKQRHYFANKCPSSQSYGFSGGYIWMWKLSTEELMLLNYGVGEDLRVPWTARRSNQSILKGDQSWVFIGRTDVEAETPILWPPDAKNWLIRKDPDAGKDWRQEDKGTTEDEMVGWHLWLDAHEFEQAPGADDGQGVLACCGSWGCKESDTTEWLNWTELNSYIIANHRIIYTENINNLLS